MAIDWDKVATKQAELESKNVDYGDRVPVTWFKPQDGSSTIRILEGWDSEGDFAGQFWREVGQHWNVSSDQKGPALCPKHTPHMEGSCKICDVLTQVKANKSNLAAQERYGRVRASTSYLMNIVDLDDPEWTVKDVARFAKDHPGVECPHEPGDTKVQVLAAGPSIFNQLLTQMGANHLDISDPKTGRDVVINKSGKGLNTRYQVTVLIKETKAPKYKELVDLSAVGFVLTNDQQLELVGGSDLPALAATNGTTPGYGSYVEDSEPVAALGETDDLEAKLRAQLAS